MSVLRMNGLQARLGGRAVLRHIELDVGEAEVVGVIGPNGAGKSTLLRVAAGLQRFDTGQLCLMGETLSAGRTPSNVIRKRLARLVAYLPQDQACHWPLSVERVVSLARLPHLSPWQRLGHTDRAALRHALQRMDLWSLRERALDTLSGGERARALLARALAVEPHLLLADEPLAGLDPEHQLIVMQALREQRERGTSSVLSIHDLSLAARYCDRLLAMDRGELVASGAPGEVLTVDLIRRIFKVDARISHDQGLTEIFYLGLHTPTATADARTP
ncbi:MAG: ABC transporter ATP-binding protein [Gammaproteobacteria bacterium]|nr:ABC transporter ATP-binding protein [Gammaproteobacteria bacterium]